MPSTGFPNSYGSLTPRGPPTPRANAAGSVAFHRFEQCGHPDAVISWLNNPACTYPCQRFATPLAGRRRMTRGRRGSLLLRRRALPSPPPCRFIPALSQTPEASTNTLQLTGGSDCLRPDCLPCSGTSRAGSSRRWVRTPVSIRCCERRAAELRFGELKELWSVFLFAAARGVQRNVKVDDGTKPGFEVSIRCCERRAAELGGFQPGRGRRHVSIRCCERRAAERGVPDRALRLQVSIRCCERRAAEPLAAVDLRPAGVSIRCCERRAAEP